MIAKDTNSPSALSNLRKLRITLQKQEQALLQKEYGNELSTIIGLLRQYRLTIDDLSVAMSSKQYKLPTKIRAKAKDATKIATLSRASLLSSPAPVAPAGSETKSN